MKQSAKPKLKALEFMSFVMNHKSTKETKMKKQILDFKLIVKDDGIDINPYQKDFSGNSRLAMTLFMDSNSWLAKLNGCGSSFLEMTKENSPKPKLVFKMDSNLIIASSYFF